MPRFSQRLGIKPIKERIQLDYMDLDLRNGLWNAFQLAVLSHLDGYSWITDRPGFVLLRIVWAHFFKRPLDELDGHWPRMRPMFREWFFNAEWFEIYDFIEFVAQHLEGEQKSLFIYTCNSALAREISGYRFIDDELGQITTEEEIQAIEGALDDASALGPVRAHLWEALEKLTSRDNPDYRNSIKESISAVEALCRLITGDDRATLGHAIKQLKDSGIRMHPALERAWSNLYGYTSDEHGIRHAMLEDANIQFTHAKYMLVTCSAFVSHLVVLAGEASMKT